MSAQFLYSDLCLSRWRRSLPSAPLPSFPLPSPFLLCPSSPHFFLSVSLSLISGAFLSSADLFTENHTPKWEAGKNLSYCWVYEYPWSLAVSTGPSQPGSEVTQYAGLGCPWVAVFSAWDGRRTCLHPLLRSRHQLEPHLWVPSLDPSARTQWLWLCSCSIGSTGGTEG